MIFNSNRLNISNKIYNYLKLIKIYTFVMKEQFKINNF